MGIVFGLLAALFWGSADFLARSSTRVIGTYRTLLYAQFFGLAVMSVILLGTGELADAGRFGLGVWLVGVITALLNMISSFALYRSLEVGTLAIVSPIAASYSAVTIVLGWLTGELLSTAHAAGVVITLIGIVLVALVVEAEISPKAQAVDHRRRRLAIPRGLWWAVVASVSFGVTFWMLGFYVTPTLGSFIPVWLIRVTTIASLTLIALVTRTSIRPPHGRRRWGLLAAIGLMDTTAFIAHTLGLASEQVAIVTVLGSLYSAVAVMLGRLFLNEHLRRSQWIGIGLIFLGIVLVSV